MDGDQPRKKNVPVGANANGHIFSFAVGPDLAARTIRGAKLLQRDVVLHRLHALNAGGNLLGARLLFRGRHETAELNDTLEGLDFDVDSLDHGVFNKRGLHFGGDGSVIDIFASALARGGSGAAHGQGGKATSTKGDEDKFLKG